MNDTKARNKLRSLDEQRKTYKDSRRDKCERHEKFCETMNDIEKTADKIKMKEFKDA